MSLPIIHQSTITSSFGKAISVEFCGEHHMGADHIEFIPSEPIAGVKRFFSTNGTALFNEADACFYLYDSSLIVRIHSESWTATHLADAPEIVYKKLVELRSKFYPSGRGGEKQINELTENDWKKGLGAAAEGVFPSAWSPFIDQQKHLR
ncbi:hypothetical protein JO972_13440 [Verrucomicrobiaceae bacterium 5K15]|uniref:Uncharacterized protein n=1 Tax=Oceaniferula flava TaxID=2800421 RepID=A0AAE2SDM2_9BACT|nr:hypothetical protein [Oceaniferula flavus]MBK1855968.1 hypothetical protein [Oceaniferula flavus]MBM1137275.1 hypothetical protein [Oceaniferula flavus]